MTMMMMMMVYFNLPKIEFETWGSKFNIHGQRII